MTKSMIRRDQRMKELAMCELRWNATKRAYIGIYPWNEDKVVSYETICDAKSVDWGIIITDLRELKDQHLPEKTIGRPTFV